MSKLPAKAFLLCAVQVVMLFHFIHPAEKESSCLACELAPPETGLILTAAEECRSCSNPSHHHHRTHPAGHDDTCSLCLHWVLPAPQEFGSLPKPKLTTLAPERRTEPFFSFYLFYYGCVSERGPPA